MAFVEPCECRECRQDAAVTQLTYRRRAYEEWMAVWAVWFVAGIMMADAADAVFIKATKVSKGTMIVSCPSGQIPDITPAQGRIQENYVIVTCTR